MTEETQKPEEEQVDNTPLADFVEGEKKEEPKEQEVSQEQPVEETPQEESAEPELSEEEQEAKRKEKQEEYYRKRQEQKAKQQEQTSNNQQTQSNANNYGEEDADLKYIRELAQKQRYQEAINSGEAELARLEKPFKEAFDDYESKVNQAMEFTKLRLVDQGYSEAQADAYLREQKVLIADRAAAQGKDPVEAVYQEANQILGAFDKFAEQLGYVKPQDKKTKMQAVREMAKPNAMTAGGQSGKLNKTTINDLDDSDIDEIKDMPLSAFMD